MFGGVVTPTTSAASEPPLPAAIEEPAPQPLPTADAAAESFETTTNPVADQQQDFSAWGWVLPPEFARSLSAWAWLDPGLGEDKARRAGRILGEC